MMTKYMIEAPHTAPECLQAVGEVQATGGDLLEKFHWGCMSGVHEGWAVLEAESESVVRDMLPTSQREKWRITEVTKFTAEDIEQYKAAHVEA